MNLTEINQWAQNIDVILVKPSKRHHAQCYKDMIVEKTYMIKAISDKIDNYTTDISEYISQLEKIGVNYPIDAEDKTLIEEEKESVSAGNLKETPGINERSPENPLEQPKDTNSLI